MSSEIAEYRTFGNHQTDGARLRIFGNVFTDPPKTVVVGNKPGIEPRGQPMREAAPTPGWCPANDRK